MADISSITTPWEGHTGSEVERFIKEQLGSKCGYFRWTQIDNYYYAEGFADDDSAREYDSLTPEQKAESGLLLFHEQLPISTIQGDSYSARLFTSMDVSQPIVTAEKTLLVPVRFCGVKTSDGERMNAGIDGTLHIRRGNTEVGTVALHSYDLDSTAYETVDVGRYLQEGEQSIRLYVTFQYTDADETVRTASSSYITISRVILTEMRLDFSGEWWKPYNGGSIDIGYFIRGYGQMYLYVQMDSTMIVNGLAVSASTEVARSVSITERSLMTNGLHTIRAWLASGVDPTVLSPVTVNQIAYFDEASATEEDKARTYIMVNALATTIYPYVDSVLMEYSVFKYGEQTVPLGFRLTNQSRSVTYVSQDLGDVPTGVNYSYQSALKIPSNVSSVFLYFTVGGVVQTQQSWEIAVDQSVDYNPTVMDNNGFILDPSTRSNLESNPKRTINAKTGSVVASSWTSNMVFSSPNGYVPDGDGTVHLHIPAGVKLSITGYDPFSTLAESGSGGSMTMELDIKIDNVYDASEPVLRVGTYGQDGKITGFLMLPMSAHVLSFNQRAIGSQDIQLQEGVRTHIAVNIVNNLGGGGLNFCRIFVNGIINREFTYSNDRFAPSGGSGGFVIGSSTAEVDLYGIRVYKQALSSQQVMQDYKSAIPSAAGKLRFHTANDILDANNRIDYGKASRLYSTMLMTREDTGKPFIPNYTNGSKVKYSNVTLAVIFRYRYATGGHQAGDINYDLSRVLTHMKVKGQGTSSMTYWMWNMRFEFTDRSEVWSVTDEMAKDTLLLSGGDCYMQFEEGGAHATKLDAKMNWASSSQSHKMGMMNAYGALWKDIIGAQSPIYAEDSRCRPCVLQEAFLFFTQAEEGGAVSFSNFMTFGPAKNDKATWGLNIKSPHYQKNGAAQKMYTCLEGSSNGRPLVEAKVPWLREEVFYYYNPLDDGDSLNETFIYNGNAQFDWDKGPADTQNEGQSNEYDTPKGFTLVSDNMWKETEDTEFDNSDPYKTNGNTVKFYRRAWNLMYLNSPFLRAFEGTYSEFMSYGSKDTTYQYFITAGGGGHAAGDCFRYNPITGAWVNAGAARSASTTDGYAALNLYDDLGVSTQGKTATRLTEDLINARLARYRAQSGNWWHELDGDLCQAWGKIMAAKDNWCKNTYFVLNPDGKLSQNRDDDDTIMDKDNVGKTGAPYQVEEHDRFNALGQWCDQNGKGEVWDPVQGDYNDIADANSYYFNSQDSLLFVLRERCRPTELKGMVGNIFQTMVAQEGTVDAFYQKHFFDIQEYLPAVAYNEVARIAYETAAVERDAGRYSNNTDPMTQSLGDQLQGERQWMKMRIPYMESFGNSTVFCDTRGGNTKSLSFRSSLAATDAGTTHNYVFRVTPHQFLYPSAGSESSYALSNRRARPGETVTLPALNVTQNNNVFIFGIDYLRSVGDFAPHPTESNSSINVSGDRLTEWVINEGGSQTVANRSISISFATPRLKRLVMRGCTALSSLGGSSLSGMTKATEIDLRGCTSLSSVTLPATDSLVTLRLPNSLSELKVEAQPNLATLQIEGYSYFTTFHIDQTVCKKISGVQAISTSLYNARKSAAGNLDIMFSGISWTSYTRAALMWYASKNADLKGTIALMPVSDYQADHTNYLSLSDLQTLMGKYKNIQTGSGGLTVTYTTFPITSIKIDGDKYFYKTGVNRTHKVTVMSLLHGNNLKMKNLSDGSAAFDVTWAFGENVSSLATIDSVTGAINVLQIGDPTVHTLNVSVKTLTATLTAETTVAFYGRVPQVGDFAYADGTFDNEYFPDKTLVGLVIKRESAGTNKWKMLVCGRNYSEATSDAGNVYGGRRAQNDKEYCYKWGITTDSNTNDNFTTAEQTSMLSAIQAQQGYEDYPSLADVPDLANIGKHYSETMKTHWFDDTAADGYGTFSADSIAADEDGKSNTAAIIEHAKVIIGQYVMKNAPFAGKSGVKIPSTLRELANLCDAVKSAQLAAGDTYSYRWTRLLYGCAYGCYLYEPAVNDWETLNAQFKKTNWYLPAFNQMWRYLAFYGNSNGYVKGDTTNTYLTPTVYYADENPESPYYGTITKEARKPIFANARYRMEQKGGTYSGWLNFSQTSTEQNGRVSYLLGNVFNTGQKSGGQTTPFCDFVWTKPS